MLLHNLNGDSIHDQKNIFNKITYLPAENDVP